MKYTETGTYKIQITDSSILDPYWVYFSFRKREDGMYEAKSAKDSRDKWTVIGNSLPEGAVITY